MTPPDPIQFRTRIPVVPPENANTSYYFSLGVFESVFLTSIVFFVFLVVICLHSCSILFPPLPPPSNTPTLLWKGQRWFQSNLEDPSNRLWGSQLQKTYYSTISTYHSFSLLNHPKIVTRIFNHTATSTQPIKKKPSLQQLMHDISQSTACDRCWARLDISTVPNAHQSSSKWLSALNCA